MRRTRPSRRRTGRGDDGGRPGGGALFAKLSNELIPAQAASVGRGANGVEVTLLPGHETLSAQLAQRYGDAVKVTICPDETSCGARPL